MQNAPASGTYVYSNPAAVWRPDDRCRGCALRGSVVCGTIQDQALAGTRLPVTRRFKRGKQIAELGKASGLLGVIRRGIARRSVIRKSGERVLLDLAIPGDIVGGIPGWQQDLDFEAATDIEICFYDSATVKRQMETNQNFRSLLLREMDYQYHRFLDWLWRNGTLTSRERIIAFLVQATDFMPTEPLADGSLVLSMVIDRSDWADLTNTAVETISRTLRYLEEKRLLTSLTPYRFRIHDLDLLATIAGLEVRDRSERKKTRLPLPEPGGRMTAVNAASHRAIRFDSVMKPVPAPRRGLA